MNAFVEILANARATSSLKPKFYWATSVVGILAAAIGIALMYYAAFALADALGIQPNERPGDTPRGLVWIVLFFAAIPLSFAAAAIPVAWLCGHVFVRIGYMAPKDVKYYALRGRYPNHWFQGGDTPNGA